MNTSSLFFDPIQTVHFLSLFTYMNKLSDVFYSEQLIREEEKNQPFPIVNAFYEYLDTAKNETEAKQQLLQKLLEGSELYGGNKNETLDMEYVNNTLDYIITSAVFHQSGNLYGYLAEIVTVSDLKLSVFKKNILEHLSYLRHVNDDGNVSKLSKLTIGKIAEKVLWPLFPDPPNDVEIISVKYIYALAGFNLAKSAQMNLGEISFEKYVTLAMTIEASAIGKELPNTVLQIFALPAMIYYACNKTREFNHQTFRNLIRDENFWSEAFLALFSYLNSMLEMIRQEAVEGNSLYQFHIAMSGFKNRTAIARDVILKECKFNERFNESFSKGFNQGLSESFNEKFNQSFNERFNESCTESLIEDYKTYSASTGCYAGAKKLPNLELIYDAQFHKIKQKYRLMEIDLLRAAFDEFPSVRNLMDEQTIVYRSYPIPNDMRCNMCSPRLPSYHPNIDFFAIKNQGEKEYYALEQNENNVTLLIQKDNDDFNKRVGLPEGRKLELAGFIKIYKRDEEDFEKFVQTFAEIKAEEFRNKLFEYGYDRTSMEKFFEIVKSFIPFYDCVKFAKADQPGPAALSCFGDVTSFVPLAGLLSTAIRMSTITAGRFLLASGLTLKTFTLRQAILTTMITGLREAALGFSEMLTKVVLTKQMFKSVSINVLRCLDPGFELVGRLAWHSKALIGRLLNKTFRYVGKNFRFLNFKYGKYETIWSHLQRKGNPPNVLKTVPESLINGREAFRFIYPGGKNPFGPKYIRLTKGYAELRRVIGFKKEVPVLVSRISRRKIFYRRINLETQEPFGLEMKLNKEGLLENVRQPFREHIHKIKTQGLGGKGALIYAREKCIQDAIFMVVNADIGVSKYQAKTKLRHYVLALDDPGSFDDLINGKADFLNSDNLEVGDWVMDVGDINLDVIDPSLDKYLPVPTYYEFALEWIRTGRISSRYSEFYISHPKVLEQLIYNRRMLNVFNIREARKVIDARYRANYFRDDEMQIDVVFDKYNLNQGYMHCTFEDYYALLAWEHYDFGNVDDATFKVYLRRSLSRLAIRQTSEEAVTLPKILCHLEIRNPLTMENYPSELIGQTSTYEKAHISVSEEEIVKQLLELDVSKVLIERKASHIFYYEIHIDSPYLAVDLSEVLLLKDSAVLLPNIHYVIQSAERTKIAGVEVTRIVMHNKPIAKETVIANLMNVI